MLPKKNRLQKKKDFERIFAQGKGFRQDLLFLKAVKNDLGILRFGIVVSKKISKSAVKRNKIKRRLREIIRLQLQNYPTSGVREEANGMDVATVVLPGIEAKNYQEIKEMTSKLFKKAEIFEKLNDKQ